MTPSQLLSILKARWLSALVVFVTTIVGTAVVSMLLPKQYTASSTLLLDTKSPDPVAGIVFGAMATQAYLATQVDVLESDRVALKVVRDLKLIENPEVRQQWTADTGARGNFEAWIAALIRKRLEVKPSPQSSVIQISYTSPDPRFATALANAFVKSYIDASLSLRVDPARQYNSFFEERAKALRANHELAQAKLSAYQREHGILATDERLDIESQRLNELNSQLVAMQAVAAEAQSRSAQARVSADQMQDVINNPLVAGLRADLSRQEAKLQELGAKLGDAHPQVVELRANIAELRLKVEAETKRVGGSVGVAGNITNARLAEARAALEAQRARILKLREQRDEVAVLLKEVDNAQRAYDAVFSRLSQSNLESQVNQTNISVLTQATEPADPSSPKVLANVLKSILIGAVLGVVFVLIREQLDRRIRTAEDIPALLDLPVIGILPKPMPGRSNGVPQVLPLNVLRRLPPPVR